MASTEDSPLKFPWLDHIVLSGMTVILTYALYAAMLQHIWSFSMALLTC